MGAVNQLCYRTNTNIKYKCIIQTHTSVQLFDGHLESRTYTVILVCITLSVPVSAQRPYLGMVGVSTLFLTKNSMLRQLSDHIIFRSVYSGLTDAPLHMPHSILLLTYVCIAAVI